MSVSNRLQPPTYSQVNNNQTQATAFRSPRSTTTVKEKNASPAVRALFEAVRIPNIPSFVRALKQVGRLPPAVRKSELNTAFQKKPEGLRYFGVGEPPESETVLNTLLKKPIHGPNAPNTKNITREMMSWLVEMGANPGTVGAGGMNAYEVAYAAGNEDILPIGKRPPPPLGAWPEPLT
jgi:hypothetical protein